MTQAGNCSESVHAQPPTATTEQEVEQEINAIIRTLGHIALVQAQKNDVVLRNSKAIIMCPANYIGSSVPNMDLEEYLQRCRKYFKGSSSVFIFAVVLIDRLTMRGVMVNSLNVHRILLTALVVAAKYLEDQVYSNKYYAQVGGVPLQELNQYELQMLSTLGFDLHIPQTVFRDYFEQLSGLKRLPAKITRPPTTDAVVQQANVAIFTEEEEEDEDDDDDETVMLMDEEDEEVYAEDEEDEEAAQNEGCTEGGENNETFAGSAAAQFWQPALHTVKSHSALSPSASDPMYNLYGFANWQTDSFDPDPDFGFNIGGPGMLGALGDRLPPLMTARSA